MYLVAQMENERHGQYYFGYEVFKEEGRNSFHLSIHTSTYDGMKRESHFQTPKVQMKSSTIQSAMIEAGASVKAYAEAILNVSV